ncbi:MAG: ATP-binding protein [Bacteroides sp.]|nr:ATP-binding protein [Bacteroides sp.]
MEFLDHKEELADLKRVLNPDIPPRFVVVFGRRRLGKSTLIKKVLGKDDIYYMADDFVDTVQRDTCSGTNLPRNSRKDLAVYPTWEDLLKMLNKFSTSQFTL